MKGAALPIFGDAYLADTHHLTLEEHGAYFKLLLLAWRSPGCSLPDDDQRLARMLAIGPAKWAKLKPCVMAFWMLSDGAWTQKRLSKERAWTDKKAASNSSSAKKRWNKQDTEKQGNEECERISERNAPPPPLSIPNGMGVPPVDTVKAIWDIGITLLTASGHEERAARSIVGRWRKEHGDGKTLAALIDCQAKSITNPVEWMAKVLNASPSGTSLLDQAQRYEEAA